MILTCCRLDGLLPNTPRVKVNNGGPKRKAVFETPMIPKVSKSTEKSSPTDGRATSNQTNTVANGVP